MRFHSRLVKLEAHQQLKDARDGEDPVPRVCGKPRHIAIADYAEWFRRRLADKGRTDEECQSIQRQIDELVIHAQRNREDYEVRHSTLAEPFG